MFTEQKVSGIFHLRSAEGSQPVLRWLTEHTFNDHLRREIERNKPALINQHEAHKKFGFGFQHQWPDILAASKGVQGCGLSIIRRPLQNQREIPYAFTHLKSTLAQPDAGFGHQACLAAVNEEIRKVFEQHRFQGYIETLFDFIPEIQPLNGQEVYLPSYVSPENNRRVPWPWPTINEELLKQQPVLDAARKKPVINEYRVVNGGPDSNKGLDELENDHSATNAFRHYLGFYITFAAAVPAIVPDDTELIDPVLFGTFLAFVKGKLVLPQRKELARRIIEGMARLNRFAEEKLERGATTRLFTQFNNLSEQDMKRVRKWIKFNDDILKTMSKWLDAHQIPPKSAEELREVGRWLELPDFHRVKRWFHAQLTYLAQQQPPDLQAARTRIKDFVFLFRGALPLIFNGSRRQVMCDARLSNFRVEEKGGDQQFVYSFLNDRVAGTSHEKRMRSLPDLVIADYWRPIVLWWIQRGRALYLKYILPERDDYGHDYLLVNGSNGQRLEEDTFTAFVEESWLDAQRQLDPPPKLFAHKIGPGAVRSLFVTDFFAKNPSPTAEQRDLLAKMLNTSVEKLHEVYNRYSYHHEQRELMKIVHGDIATIEILEPDELPVDQSQTVQDRDEEEAALSALDHTPTRNPKVAKKRQRFEPDPPKSSKRTCVNRAKPPTHNAEPDPTPGSVANDKLAIEPTYELYDVQATLTRLRDRAPEEPAAKLHTWLSDVEDCLKEGLRRTSRWDQGGYFEKLSELRLKLQRCWYRDSGKLNARAFAEVSKSAVLFVESILDNMEQVFAPE